MNPSKYNGSKVSADVKEQTMLIAAALKDRDMSNSTILDILSNTNYFPSERTLQRNLLAIKERRPMFSDNKASGHPPGLSDEKWYIVCGWILLQENKVNLEAVLDWINANFDVKLNKSSISRNLQRLELSFQLAGKRGTK